MQIPASSFLSRHPALRSLIAESGITTDEIAHAKARILAEYVRLDALLPADHLWKGEKIEHAQNCAQEVSTHATLLGLEGVERDVFEFLLFAHDVGRLQEALEPEGETMERSSIHGTYSAAIIRQALGFTEATESPLWHAILLAITHHSDRNTPTRESLGGSDAAFALTCVIRDIDKLGGFDQATSYTADETFKAHERLVSWKRQREADPEWGKEMNIIAPPDLLWDAFLNGRIPDRSRCRSYEAHMLQYLAWVFDVNTPEILHLIVTGGGPKMVYEYLVSQLQNGSTELRSPADREEAARQLAAMQVWANEWMDGVLLK